VDVDGWKAELPGIVEYMQRFGNRLPARIAAQLEQLQQRLG